VTTTTEALPGGRDATAPRPPGRSRRARTGWTAALLGPGLAIVAVFVLVPILLTAWISVHEWSMYTPFGEMDYVGPANYADVLGDRTFRQALVNTGVYTVLSVALLVPLALGVGLLLNSAVLRGRTALRTVLFATYMIPTVAVAIIWSSLYAPQYGPINQALTAVGLPAQAWLGSVDLALVSLVIFNVWQLLGYFAVLYLAGLMQIPSDLYEAASLDGAGSVRQTRFITVPMLRRTTTFVVVIALINSVQVFDPIYVLTQGGPAGSTNVLSFHIYRTAFDFGSAGRASAMAFLMLGVLVLAVAPLLRLGRER
jgi:multiple sugar transport system permease protein